VDGPRRGASGRPAESATLTTDSTANHRPSKASGESGDAVASAADRRRQRQLSIDPSVILSSRPSVQPLRHRTQAAECSYSRGCFAEVLKLVMSGIGFGIVVLALVSPELIDKVGSQMGFGFSDCVKPF